MEYELPVEEKMYRAKIDIEKTKLGGKQMGEGKSNTQNMEKKKATMDSGKKSYKPEAGMLSSESDIIQKKSPNYKNARYEGLVTPDKKIIDKFSPNYKDDRYK